MQNKGKNTNKKYQKKIIDKKTQTNTKRVELQKPVSAKIIAFILLFISVLTYFVYSPSLKNDFTNWDDNSYVEENPVIKNLDKAALNEMFFSEDKNVLYHMGNYHPLSMLSLSIDHALEMKYPDFFKQKGMKLRGERQKEYREFDPYIYHLHNVLLHILNSLLVFAFVFLLLGQMENKKRIFTASLASLLFALTSIHVESVTWISERKDVLYAFYFLISINLYLIYLQKKNFIFYLLSLFAFVLSLLSKGQAVSLAVSLVAIDLFFARTDYKKLILEKIPFFALSLVFGLIAIKAQAVGEAIHDIGDYPIYYRILFAAYGLTMYFFKLLIPSNLAAVYPYPYPEVPVYFWFFLIPLALYIWTFIYFYKKEKIIAFALAYFVINVFLVLQLLPVGSAIMADRYAYVSSVGFALLLAYLLVELGFRSKNMYYLSILIVFGYSIFLSQRTFAQTKIWVNSNSLWEHTLSISPYAVVAWNNWGSAIDKIANEEKNSQRKVELKTSAIEKFNKAVEIKKDYAHAFYNRGTSRKDIGLEVQDPNFFQLAVTDFTTAIEIKSDFPEAYQNRAISKENLGKFEEALSDFDNAIRLKPNAPDLYSGRGVVMGKLGKLNQAIENFTKSIEINPKYHEGYSNRGFAYYLKGNVQQAMSDYNKALEIAPDNPDALFNRGVAFAFLKQFENALADYNKVELLKPSLSMLYINRGIVLVNLGKKDMACNDFAKAKNMGIGLADNYINAYCK